LSKKVHVLMFYPLLNMVACLLQRKTAAVSH